MTRTARVLHLALFFACVLCCRAQPGIEWQKCLGGSNSDYTSSHTQTADGGYIVVGYTFPTGADSTDLWVVKLDADGAMQWQTVLGGSHWDQANAVLQVADGGYVVAGWTESLDGDVVGKHGDLYASDAWIVKLDSAGHMQWQRCLGGSSDDFAYSIQQTSGGGYIIAGRAFSNDGDVSGNGGGREVWVVNLDAAGVIQWWKTFGGASYEYALSAQQTFDGGYMVVGYTNSNDGDVSGNHGGLDAWMLKLDATGDLQWQKCIGGSSDEEAYSIQQTADSGYIVAGHTWSNDVDVSGNHGGRDMWVVKLDEAGVIQWQQCLGGSHYDGASSTQQTPDGGYIVAGYTYSNNGDVTGFQGGVDVWAVKLNDAGAIQWQKCMGGSSAERAHSIQRTTDNGYSLAGETTSSDGDVSGHNGDWDGWVVKLGPDEVGVEEEESARFTVFPSPAHAHVDIGFAPNARPRIISLLDATGRIVLVQAIANDQQRINMDLSGQVNGLYLMHAFFADGTHAVERIMKE